MADPTKFTDFSLIDFGSVDLRDAQDQAFVLDKSDTTHGGGGTYKRMIWNAMPAVPVYNNSGVTISKGDPIHAVGENSGYLTVKKADAGTAADMPAFALAAADITNNNWGVAQKSGWLNNVNTSGFTTPAILYVADGGGLTTTAPSGAGDTVQAVGLCMFSNATTGKISIAIRDDGVPLIDGASFTDVNGDEHLTFRIPSTPVNYWEIWSAATATALKIAAAGTDSNIDVQLDPKGTGTFVNPKPTYTPYNAGTKSTGTYTPAASDGAMQYAVNGGAHTLAPQTTDGVIIVQYTNNASAGAITTTGFDKVTGDPFTTTDGDDFVCVLTVVNGFQVLNVTAMQ